MYCEYNLFTDVVYDVRFFIEIFFFLNKKKRKSKSDSQCKL